MEIDSKSDSYLLRFYVGSEAGLKKLDEYLLSRSYITGYQASKDNLTVHAAFTKPPSPQYVNVSRWFTHIDALLRIFGVSAEGSGVVVEGSASFPEEAIATPPVADTKAAADEDEDSDVDLFGEETEEEKKIAEERATTVKASGKKKESGKSSVLLDVKPWDDETDMQKLEEPVRSVQMEGLLWGASKLVPVGYGIKKLQIMMTIVDDLVSVDTIIEERLTAEPINEYVQSCDIVAFNKIFLLDLVGQKKDVGVVPADGVLISGHSLSIDESIMTGESKIVHKDHKSPFLMSGCKATIVIVAVPEGLPLVVTLTLTPLENLEPVLREDIQKIWDSVPKPEAHKHTPLSDLFNVEVVALSSFSVKEEQFKEQADLAKQRVDEYIYTQMMQETGGQQSMVDESE
ncbi:hypothetical protein Lser_V15G22216 [Lactuca serriola]